MNQNQLLQMINQQCLWVLVKLVPCVATQLSSLPLNQGQWGEGGLGTRLREII